MFARNGFWTAALIALCAACGSKSDNGGQDSGAPKPDVSGQDIATGLDQGTQDLECTPGSKAVGEPCTAASECATCKCEDVNVATNGQFRICTSKCVKHEQCGENEVCLYPTVQACVPSCSTVNDCPTVYNSCSTPTGAYKFCNVQ